MEALIRKVPNTCNNFTIQYFDEEYKCKILTFKTINDARLFIADLSNFEAKIKFEGEKFEVYEWKITPTEHIQNLKLAKSHLK